ncbi:MAG: MFS transporter [Pseudomonadales bacterium]|nr:MFS transporter [Pseudomonadales bacterium]
MHNQGFGSAGYRGYVLGALLLAYILNFVDRIMIGILAEPIIEHFGLSDSQFGLLSGVAFAVFYSALGIPIARLSEHVNRVYIIGTAILLWSLMTVLCGFASSFWMLFAFRLGVGIGEAGLTPPANSLISDYFKPSARTRALAIYSTGITLGMFLANLFVGLTGGKVDWQQTFIIVGLAGIPVGLLILFSVKEAPRGYTDPAGSAHPTPASLRSTLQELASKPTFWAVTMGGTATAFVGYGTGNFTISFLVRNFDLSVAQAALYYMAPLTLGGAVGTWLCGLLIGRFAGGRNDIGLRLTAISLVLSAIFYISAFNSSNTQLIFPLLMLGNFFHYWHMGPMYGSVGAVVSTRVRATAIAILLFVINLIGYGLGPLFVGWLSDRFAAAQLVSSSGPDLATCLSSSAMLGPDQLSLCSAASAYGLRTAITLTIFVFFIAAFCFALASLRFNRDAHITVQSAES